MEAPGTARAAAKGCRRLDREEKKLNSLLLLMN
jgi:hypothetical protein